jgi:hypothetical protein
MRDRATHLQLVSDAEQRDASRGRRAFRDHPPAAAKAFIALPADADDFDDMGACGRLTERELASAECCGPRDQCRMPCPTPWACYGGEVLDGGQPGAPEPSPAIPIRRAPLVQRMALIAVVLLLAGAGVWWGWPLSLT